MKIRSFVVKVLSGTTRPYNSANGSAVRLLKIKFDTVRGFLLVALSEMLIPRSGFGRLLAMRGSKAKQTAVVIGNGPSSNRLNIEQLTRVKRELSLEIYCVNFALNVMPDLINLCDFLVLSDEVCKIDSTDTRSVFLWDLLTTNDRIRVITPLKWHSPQVSYCRDNSCLHFSDKSLEGLTSNIDLGKPRGYPSMTSFKALAIGAHLGYSEIYIVGFDNDLFRAVFVDEENRIIQGQNHAGKIRYQIKQDVSHFYPEGIGDYFFDVSYLFLNLRRCFSKLAIKNLDEWSLVDAFSKKITNKEMRQVVISPTEEQV